MTIIRVEGHEIDTKDIVKITDAGWRRIGFHIHLVGPRVIKIDRSEPYDMMPMDVRELYRRYEELKRSVENKWEADKSEIETFNL
tara:strand:- start:5276 stop:5530 length:255 start_codon:yes stop_codon:yes gene_type:complete